MTKKVRKTRKIKLRNKKLFLNNKMSRKIKFNKNGVRANIKIYKKFKKKMRSNSKMKNKKQDNKE